MTEEELKVKYDKQVSAPDKERLWQWLKDDHYVSDVCREAMAWEEFKAEADRLAQRQREMVKHSKPLGRSPNLPYIDIRLTDLEAKHAVVLAPYLAKRAALLPEVRNFREEKLGGDTLEWEEVATFLRSELRHLPSEEYLDLEWALEQIPSFIDGDEVEEVVDLVGGWANRGLESQSRYLYENIRRAAELDSMAMAYVPSGQFLYGVMHLIRDKTGRTLEDLSRWLLSRYPWPLRDAAWFVVTDEPPEVEALRVQRDPAKGTHLLTFAPWISEKTIRLAYRSVQSGDNRPLRDKSLSTFHFVNEHTAGGETPKWAELTERWNKQYPDARYTDRSALRSSYRRVERQLVPPWMKESEAHGRGSGGHCEDGEKFWDLETF